MAPVATTSSDDERPPPYSSPPAAPPASGAPPSQRTVRVAIIGSGLTGLVATYLLTSKLAQRSSERQDEGARARSPSVRICVEIFERSQTLGMDSASISVPLKLVDPQTAEHDLKHRQPKVNGGPGSASSSPERPGNSLAADCDDSATVAAAAPATAGKSMRIDVPMRAFTGGYYPELLALYRHLGIRVRRTNFTYSFASLPSRLDASTDSASPALDSGPAPSLIYNGASGLRGISMPSAISWRRSDEDNSIAARLAAASAYFGRVLLIVFSYLQLLLLASWHHHLGHTSDPHHPIYTMTLQQFALDPLPSTSPAFKSKPPSLWPLGGLRLPPMLRSWLVVSPAFLHATVVPLFSAVMTCSAESVLQSPAAEVLDYVALTFGKNHYVVRDGVREVVRRLLVHVPSPSTAVDGEVETEGREREPIHAAARSGAGCKADAGSQSRVWTSAEVRKIEHRDGKAYITASHDVTASLDDGGSDAIPTPASSANATDSEGDDDTPGSRHAPSTPRRQRVERQHGGYDHLIFATQANQAASFLGQYIESLRGAAARGDGKDEQRKGNGEEEQATATISRLEEIRDRLLSFRYEQSVVVNHTDTRVLPPCRDDWRDLNLVSPLSSSLSLSPSMSSSKPRTGSSAHPAGDKKEWRATTHTMATHILVSPRHPHGRGQEQESDGRCVGGAGARVGKTVMQTTNPHTSLLPDRRRILSQSHFERITLNVDAKLARHHLFSLPPPEQGRGRTRKLELGKLQGRPTDDEGKGVGVWTCGSWSVGIPLLEGCVVSARLVVEALLAQEGLEIEGGPPWLTS